MAGEKQHVAKIDTYEISKVTDTQLAENRVLVQNTDRPDQFLSVDLLPSYKDSFPPHVQKPSIYTASWRTTRSAAPLINFLGQADKILTSHAATAAKGRPGQQQLKVSVHGDEGYIKYEGVPSIKPTDLVGKSLAQHVRVVKSDWGRVPIFSYTGETIEPDELVKFQTRSFGDNLDKVRHVAIQGDLVSVEWRPSATHAGFAPSQLSLAEARPSLVEFYAATHPAVPVPVFERVLDVAANFYQPPAGNPRVQ